MDFKQIPLEFVDNNIIFASKDGQIKIGEKLIMGYKSNKGANGYYRTFGYKNKSYYVHKLVFYAHSDLTLEQLKNGRVIFKNFNSDMIDENQIYKCRFEDLLFEPFKIIKEEPTEENVRHVWAQN
jgi:hypothetical protein